MSTSKSKKRGPVKLVRAAASIAAATTMAMQAAAVPGVNDAPPLVSFRNYQQPVFWDDTTKTLILHWSRQIGKSYTLAGWAVDRLLRYPGRLVTVLSNSRDNGAEFVPKAQEICRKLGQAIEIESNKAELDRSDLAEDVKFSLMNFEIRIAIKGKVGRIKVLAANPRTARGFSGDLILDEFSFHENSRAIWEAAEPIISANKDFLCRISSTGNGRQNMFYQLISEGRIPVNRVRRSDAWRMGELKIYSIIDGREITPGEARAEASDKRAYDQNYECAFNDENMALLTQELISAAQREGVTVDEQEWSAAAVSRMYRAQGDLHAGVDVGRNRDLSVITVIEKIGQSRRIIGMLRMEQMRLPQQQSQLAIVGLMPKFRRAEIDMTGIGLGLYEYSEDTDWGRGKIGGVNFASTEPVTRRIQAEGRKAATARVTEIMATDMVDVFEAKAIEIPDDPQLRDDLRKPEKITSPGGRVSIAAVRDEAGHADHFWSVALAIRAGLMEMFPGTFAAFGVRPGGGREKTRQEIRATRRLMG